MIPLKSEKEIQIMAEAGKRLARITQELKKKVAPGIKTRELDRLAESLIFKFEGKPSFKGYENFPNSLCVSVNEEIVHGLPSDRTLEEGDIVSLDLGFFSPVKMPGADQGFHVDMAITVPVGKVNPQALRLIRVTKKILKLAIKKAKVGNTFGDIGNTIQRYVESQGYNVVRDLCGHGIGKKIHEEPQIMNYGKRKTGPKIKEGMVFCLEPMLTMGDWQIERAKDGFAYKTKDDSLSAHFEHTIAITQKGPKVLTKI